MVLGLLAAEASTEGGVVFSVRIEGVDAVVVVGDVCGGGGI